MATDSLPTFQVVQDFSDTVIRHDGQAATRPAMTNLPFGGFPPANDDLPKLAAVKDRRVNLRRYGSEHGQRGLESLRLAHWQVKTAPAEQERRKRSLPVR